MYIWRSKSLHAYRAVQGSFSEGDEPMYRILLIEDEPALAEAIARVMTSWGHEVCFVKDFRNVLGEFTACQPQLIIMDLMLPFFNGHYWTQQIRQVSGVPIVYLSSASDDMNVIMAMNMGGDEFIAKPVDPAVLMARVNAVLRRAYNLTGATNVIAHGRAVLDLNSASLMVDGKNVPLTRNEFIILRTLMEQPGKVISRDMLMTRLWQMDEYVEENTLTVNVARLRKKLDAEGLAGFISTRVGSGYALSREDER